jgi:hypothetical protein
MYTERQYFDCRDEWPVRRSHVSGEHCYLNEIASAPSGLRKDGICERSDAIACKLALDIFGGFGFFCGWLG